MRSKLDPSDLPLVSVVVPCLNRARFLEPTLESILQQDYPHIECIVVDGGSTDSTVEILRRYGDRIQWVSEPDRGHADAINKGWRMSSGEILAWLNADDLWKLPDAVSQAVAYLQGHPEVDVVYGDCGAIDAEGDVIGMAYLHEWDLEYAVEHWDHCIPQPASFIRRRILEQVGWLDTGAYIQDWDLWLRIGLVGRIQHIPAVLAYARRVPGLMSNGRKAATSCVRLAEKFFALPEVPKSLHRKRRRAVSNAYLRGIQYAYSGGRRWILMARFTLRAVLADPTNLPNVFGKTLSLVAIGARGILGNGGRLRL